MRNPTPAICTALLLAGLLTGCEAVTYVLHVADGELGIQGESEPIDKVLDSGRLTTEENDKLRLVVQARQYAADVMGLNAANSYETFFDAEGQPLAWNLSAGRQDRLEAATWTFPIVGTVPYLSFYDEDYLRRVEDQLKSDGFDTLTYELDAYSTLGVLENPVRSPMLRRNDLSLVETVIHELLHNTVWRPNNTTFNESLATFVGRQGAVDFLVANYGEDSGWPDIARDYYADQDAINVFLRQLYADLDAYYAQSLSSSEKVAGREAVFQAARDRFAADIQPTLNYPDVFGSYATLPTNNAWVLANYRYNLDLELMRSIHAATGEDWAATLDVFRAAATSSGDPFAYLRDWLAAQGG
jgi:predicted aminopeptidase